MTFDARKLPTILFFALASQTIFAETCNYGQVGESIMISNLPLKYGKKGSCFGSADTAEINTHKKNTVQKSRTSIHFPGVDAVTQQKRDSTRQKILADELAAERAALGQAKTTGKVTDIQLHEKNIQMLEKEISGSK